MPGAVSAANITLRNGGILKTAFATLTTNRGITLDGGGTLLPNSDLAYAGVIAGTGPLKIGLASDSSTSVTLSGTNTYTGGSDVVKGTLAVTKDAALGATPGALDVANITLRNGAVPR